MLLKSFSRSATKRSAPQGRARWTAKLSLSIVFFVLAGCATQNYGDDIFRLQMASHGKDVMWVPTKIERAHEMLSAANVKTGDIVFDLGSGDGVIPIEAAKKFGVSAVGIEYNPDLVELSKRNAKRAGVNDKTSFRRGDIFVEDFSEATVLTLYLGESLNARLMPKILKMQPGTRVVSNTFRMDAWIPDREINLSSGGQAYLWIVPAQIDGQWELKGPPELNLKRLQIRQKKQFFDGVIELGNRQKIFFEDGRLQGSRLKFEFFDRDKKRHSIEATVLHEQLEGVVIEGTSRTSISGIRAALHVPR